MMWKQKQKHCILYYMINIIFTELNVIIEIM